MDYLFDFSQKKYDRLKRVVHIFFDYRGLDSFADRVPNIIKAIVRVLKFLKFFFDSLLLFMQCRFQLETLPVFRPCSNLFIALVSNFSKSRLKNYRPVLLRIKNFDFADISKQKQSRKMIFILLVRALIGLKIIERDFLISL